MPKAIADVLEALRIGLFCTLIVFCLATVFAGQQPTQQFQSYPQNQQKEDKSSFGEPFWQRTTTDPVAFFTFWLTAFTGVLSVSTIGLWVSTRKAAKIAERALVDLERPRIYASISDPGLTVVFGSSCYAFGSNRVEHRCVNFGRSPAFLTEYVFQFPVLRAGRFPDPIVPPPRGQPQLPVGCVSTIDAPYVEGNFSVNVYAIDLLLNGALAGFRPYFIGYVRYDDSLGNHYISGFCALYDWIGERYVLKRDDRYNYEREEV